MKHIYTLKETYLQSTEMATAHFNYSKNTKLPIVFFPIIFILKIVDTYNFF